MSKFKEHLEKHKTVYIAGGTGLVVGAAIGATIVLKNNALVNVRPIQILTWKSKQTIEVFVEALGDPGNIVQCLETGTVYASQGQAARELGVNAGTMSRHISGVLPNVKGFHFNVLGKAPVSQ